MELVKLVHLFFIMTIPYSFGKLVNMEEYRDMVVNMHNMFRRKISATDMREIVWDSNLADKAGYWSKWCTYERHNYKHHTKYGENLYVGQPGDNQRVAFEGLQDWYDQGESYSYQPFETRCGDTCEYTQLVWANTAKVGCAMNKCGRLFNGYQTLSDVMLFVCFYESKGNIRAEFPYQPGIQCSDCQPGTVCRDSLCSDDPYQPFPISETADTTSELTENPSYMYAEGRPTSYYVNQVDRRRYPADLRYRRTHQEQLRRRQEEEERRRQQEDEHRRKQEDERRRQQEAERRRQREDERKRQQEEERRRQQEAERRRQREDERKRQQEEDRWHRQEEDERRRRQQNGVRRTPVRYDRRRPQNNPVQSPPEYYARSQHTYTDEYSRVCSCDCRPNARPPYTSVRRPYVSPVRQYAGVLTQPEKYELISVHNLMRDERKLPRIHWNAELEKWSTYVIRCDEEFPGPRNTYSNFGKMVENEDLYTFVHAWGSEGGHLTGRGKHCRATDNNTNCNRHNNIMRREIRGFACATSRCTNHRQIICLYR